MAKRKTVEVDGQFIDVAHTSTIDQIVPQHVKSVTTHDGQVIHRDQFQQTPTPEGFATNLSETNKGTPLSALLAWETRAVQTWLDSFEAPLEGRRMAHLHPSGQLMFVQSMPLPDHYEHDEADVMLVIDGFPSRPPIGLYVLNQHERSVRQLSRHFSAFRNQAFHEAPALPGYTWICFHYKDNNWRYDARNPAAHDNLHKFLNNFFAEA